MTGQTAYGGNHHAVFGQRQLLASAGTWLPEGDANPMARVACCHDVGAVKRALECGGVTTTG